MNQDSVPTIFSRHRTSARIRRALSRSAADDSATFIWDDIAEEMIERLAFVRHQPKNALVLGAAPAALTAYLGEGKYEFSKGTEFEVERPFPKTGFDHIAVLGLLDAVNDLPGTLIHIRNALAPSGLAIASFVGGASLTKLRTAMLAADGDRPAARIHPLVDARAAPQLLQRAGWKDPVVDSHTLKVRYSSLDRLVNDLRDHGLGNALKDHGPALSKPALERARAAFLQKADADGKVSETIEIITLTGRRSLAGT